MNVKFCAEIIVIFMIATGCATYGEIEKDFGKSYAMAKSGQILNPAASKNLKPVIGLSGDAAAAGMEKYTQSFGKGAQKPASKGYVVPVIPTDTGGM